MKIKPYEIEKLANNSLVLLRNEEIILYSYDTPVLSALIDYSHTSIKTFLQDVYLKDYSQTTMKHINKFISEYNLYIEDLNLQEVNRRKIKSMLNDF